MRQCGINVALHNNPYIGLLHGFVKEFCCSAAKNLVQRSGGCGRGGFPRAARAAGETEPALGVTQSEIERRHRPAHVGAVIGEIRHDRGVDLTVTRRLSLAASRRDGLAFLLRTRPGTEASAAATRWIVGAAPSRPTSGSMFFGPGPSRFEVRLVRNRRGHLGCGRHQPGDAHDAGGAPATVVGHRAVRFRFSGAQPDRLAEARGRRRPGGRLFPLLQRLPHAPGRSRWNLERLGEE